MIEKMSDFFTARVNGYDSHMMNEVAGCKEGYQKMAEILPETMVNLLDLGCGTGLELDEIFKIYPNIKVTGVDLTKAMLEVLKQKHPDKNLTLIHASYFDYDFGNEAFDAVISFQTMHHFPHDKKIELYSRIYSALKPGGKYIECDYMVTDPKDEEFYFKESARIRNELNIPDGEFYHYDTPCTVDNQVEMLRIAKFDKVETAWRIENTTIIVAEKDGKMMLSIVRGSSNNQDFIDLTYQLDADLNQRNGASQSEYDPYNVIQSLDTVVIAYVNDTPAGCGCFKRYNDDTVEIKRIFVTPVHRGKGISKTILAELEKWAVERGFLKSILETGMNQTEAIGLYQTSGYSRIDNFSPYIGMGQSVCFGKCLKNNG